MKSIVRHCFIIMALIATTILPMSPAYAAVDPFNEVCKGQARNTAVCGDRGRDNRLLDIIQTAISLLLILGGIVAVIMIIVGGIRYVMSGGDSNSTSSAKNTVLYAVVGLVIAIMSYAIVNFVLDRL